MGDTAKMSDEELQKQQDSAKARTGLLGKVADFFDPTTRKNADAAAVEAKRRAAQKAADEKAATETEAAKKKVGEIGFARGGAVKAKRGDGIAQRGRTRGKVV